MPVTGVEHQGTWRRFARRRLKTEATVALYRAGAVRETLRFARRELAGPRGRLGEYTLRRGGARCVLRHRSADLEIFHELLISDAYVPPPEALGALAAATAPRVLDLGANIGLFGVRVLGLWPEARIEAVEPDPENLRLLERCIALNDAADRWVISPAFAAAAAAEEVPFLAGLESMSRRARPGEDQAAIAVRAIDVLPMVERSDLLKIDIEGAEWEILSDPRLAASPVRAVVLEYHGPAGAGPNEEAEQELTAAGFAVRTVHRDDSIGVGLIWGWRA